MKTKTETGKLEQRPLPYKLKVLPMLWVDGNGEVCILKVNFRKKSPFLTIPFITLIPSILK